MNSGTSDIAVTGRKLGYDFPQQIAYFRCVQRGFHFFEWRIFCQQPESFVAYQTFIVIFHYFQQIFKFSNSIWLFNLYEINKALDGSYPLEKFEIEKIPITKLKLVTNVSESYHHK